MRSDKKYQSDLYDNANDAEKDYFNSIVAHEKAISQFAIREINSGKVDSLQPVLDLLI